MHLIWINGMPRSGTSWLSQIFDSHPDVRFRLAPLFSYRFKDYLNLNSTPDECYELFDLVYHTSGDEFMEQLYRKREGSYPIFEDKNANPRFLVIKDTRYHNLTDMLIKNVPELKFIHIIRNPCATINSWLKNPKEFNQDLDPLEFWKSGANRKNKPEEFWGFDDWVKLTKYYSKLSSKHPDQVTLTKYEDLVHDPVKEVSRLFKFCNLGEIPDQTSKFIHESQNASSQNEFSVFRGKNNVLDKWETELPKEIKNEIFDQITGTELEKYL